MATHQGHSLPSGVAVPDTCPSFVIRIQEDTLLMIYTLLIDESVYMDPPGQSFKVKWRFCHYALHPPLLSQTALVVVVIVVRVVRGSGRL